MGDNTLPHHYCISHNINQKKSDSHYPQYTIIYASISGMKGWNVESNSDNAKNLTGTIGQWSVDSQDTGTVATSAMDAGRTIITMTCM